VGRVKENLTILKVLWIVWVWEPIARMLHPWAVHFGFQPCCGNPQPRITGVADQEVQECLNCGHIRNHGTWYFLP